MHTEVETTDLHLVHLLILKLFFFLYSSMKFINKRKYEDLWILLFYNLGQLAFKILTRTGTSSIK